MTHFKWLKKEIPRWVKEEIITREAGDSLISLYRNEERHSHGEGLFVLAAVCFLTGLIFICSYYCGDFVAGSSCDGSNSGRKRPLRRS